MEKHYTTSQVAKIIGIHPNTVRLYEEMKLISPPMRQKNGYRVFTDQHIDQFKLARMAFQIEVLQNGLRKRIIEVIKESALGYFDKAIELTKGYLEALQQEIKNAEEAVAITHQLLQGPKETGSVALKRIEVSRVLGISMDTLRNWELNGLLEVKRKENGYRVYTYEDLQRLKIIRSLKCANYSLSAILRMLKALSRDTRINIQKILNTPEETENIISVCDKLVISLNEASINAQKMLALLNEMKIKYSNPPL